MATKQSLRFSAQTAQSVIAQIQQWVNSGKDQIDDKDDEVGTGNTDEKVYVKLKIEDAV